MYLFLLDKPAQSRDDVIAGLLPYVAAQLEDGAHLNHITRHILGLYQGVPGARKFRRHLSENAYKPQAGLEVLTEAHRLVREAEAYAEARNRQPAAIEFSTDQQEQVHDQ